MMTTGSRTNSTDSDYELMQQHHPPPPPHQPDGRLRRGYSNSTRDPRQPPQYQAPRPPRPSRISPNRWRHLHRLSPGRNRNYAGLQDLNRRMEGGEYAVPRVNRDTEGRRYDGFFQGSIAEEEGVGEGEEEEAEKSIGDMTIMSETTEPCCRHCKCILLGLFLVLLLLTSLGGLGLALYNKFTRDGPSNMQEMGVVDTCAPTWCELTVTRAAHAYNCTLYNNSRECTTEPLSTNIPGLTPLRFHCIADTHNSSNTCSGQSYQNEMHRDEEGVMCTCKFSTYVCGGRCSVVGDYCEDEGIENSTNRTSI